MGTSADAPSVQIEYQLASTDLPELRAHDTLLIPLDPTKPHLTALQAAIEAAREQMNGTLTTWKDALGEQEKSKEAVVQRAYDEAKKAAGKADEEEEEEEAT